MEAEISFVPTAIFSPEDSPEAALLADALSRGQSTERPVVVTLLRAAYGGVSGAVFQLQGTPPRGFAMLQWATLSPHGAMEANCWIQRANGRIAYVPRRWKFAKAAHALAMRVRRAAP